MKKRLAALAAVAMILSGLGMMTASPAQAHVVECVVAGTATLSGGLGLPPSSNSVTFSLTGQAACTPPGVVVTVNANGSLVGACGRSSGGGTASAGAAHASASFTYESAASVLVLSGGVVGVVNAVADATVSGNSCVAGTAFSFRVQGTVAFTV